MHACARSAFLSLLVIPSILSAAEQPASSFVFRDILRDAGLESAEGIRGHGAGWGDADGDGLIDLYVGTFHNEGSKANQFFRNLGEGKFKLDDQAALNISTRASAALFADFDNDGDLDLYVSSMPIDAESKMAKKEGHGCRGCSLFRNDGKGKFIDVSQDNGACPAAFGGRSATVLDFDGDGLVDLLVGEDPIKGYNGSTTASSRLFRNFGDLKFVDVTRPVGLPQDVPGYGVAAADVNNDGWPDIFIAANKGGNRLFLNDGHGKFHERAGSRETFDWETPDGDDMICGVAFGDVNRDGLLDMVLGQHFQSPWKMPIANRLYLNRGVKDGVPQFDDVTKQAGLIPLPMKSPHVEIQDFDNDGWPDIYTTIVKFADGQPHPLIFRNLGLTADGSDATPKFAENVLALNDFPNAEDLAVKRTGDFFDKMIRDHKIMYTAPGPTGDYDNDGRLDMFLASWWIEQPSLLLHNETKGGHWLDVQVRGEGEVNRMGIGTRVKLYPAGNLGDAKSLIGCGEVAAGYGYASAQAAICHFGLGDVERVDVEVTLPHGNGTVVRNSVEADQRITIDK